MLMPPIVHLTFLYLMVGVATTAIAWARMPDEIEMSIDMDLDDEADRPVLRSFVAFMFVISWPMVLAEVLRKR
jgi:hypothetical protein